MDITDNYIETTFFLIAKHIYKEAFPSPTD